MVSSKLKILIIWWNTISTISSSGVTTEIYKSNNLFNVSVGNSIGIGTETLGILGILEMKIS